MLALARTAASPSSPARPMVCLPLYWPPRRLNTCQTAVARTTKFCQVRILTTGVKTLLRRLTASDKFLWWWPDQRNHERQMLERVVTSFQVKYVLKQMLPFKEVPNLLRNQQGTPIMAAGALYLPSMPDSKYRQDSPTASQILSLVLCRYVAGRMGRTPVYFQFVPRQSHIV